MSRPSSREARPGPASRVPETKQSREIALQPRQASVPTLLMRVACSQVGELAVREGEIGAAVLGAQLHGHEAYAFLRALPHPRVHELRRRAHLAIHGPTPALPPP